MKRNLIQTALASMLVPIARPFAAALMRSAVPWAEYNYKGGVVNGGGSGPTYNSSPLSIVEVKFDMDAIADERVANNRTAIAAADVLNAVGVKAGTWVPMVALQVVTAEGAAATADVGDGSTAAGFISNADLNVVGWTSSLITTTYSLATAGGKLYTADDTIDLVIDSNNVDAAVFHLFVPMFDLRKVR